MVLRFVRFRLHRDSYPCLHLCILEQPRLYLLAGDGGALGSGWQPLCGPPGLLHWSSTPGSSLRTAWACWTAATTMTSTRQRDHSLEPQNSFAIALFCLFAPSISPPRSSCLYGPDDSPYEELGLYIAGGEFYHPYKKNSLSVRWVAEHAKYTSFRFKGWDWEIISNSLLELPYN